LEQRGKFDKSKVKCFSCQEKGHYAYECKNRNTDKGGHLGISSTPGYKISDRMNGRIIDMVIDSGCCRTLVHEKFVGNNRYTGELMTVLMANGDRTRVPLAWVEIRSQHGIYKELVGVMHNLPVDCLLGRSSFGLSLTKEDLLKQWDQCVRYSCQPGNLAEGQAFVLTRRQVALQQAQTQLDQRIDKQNQMIVEKLQWNENQGNNESVDDYNLNELFETEPNLNEHNEEPNKECKAPTETIEGKHNILNRDRAQLIQDQAKDVTLSNLKVLDIAPLETEGFFRVNNVLMHRKFNKYPHDGLFYVDRIVVPEVYRPEILRLGHTIPLAGHMGQEKTFERISMHFFWPRLYSEVKNYCATCPQCQLVERKLVNNRAPPNPVKIVTEPFKKVAIDLIGELPRSKNGYKYILTLVDYATRYPEAIPLKTTQSRVVAEALVNIFSRVGLPEEIVSDQGANLVGNLMKQLYELLGIRHIKTSVYHPEANGLVERFNGTLKHMLKKFVGREIESWDKYLPFVLFAYREVPCQSTGYSPFELLFGRTVRGPLTAVKHAWVSSKISKDYLDYVLETRKRLTQMQEIVHENLKGTQEKQKKLYDRQSFRRLLGLGDKVLVLLPTPGSKLEMKWQGHFIVSKVFENGLNYEVDRGKGRNKNVYIILIY
jgi:hypothetical protein